jgi:uncharacterized protein (DUF2235 family)
MALYAFDGTWNENRPGNRQDTNVYKFYQAYGGAGVAAEAGARKWYVEGVGTRFGWLGRIFGGVFGAGGKQRVGEAFQALRRNFREGDTTIDIVGFSRGGALALDFANRIAVEGVDGRRAPGIRFIGVWDVVASFGIPGNDINLGYVLTVPPNVRKCFHAMALDERRRNFVQQRLVTNVEHALREGRVYEVWFRGVHSDIGGGNGKEGLPNITLHWMLRQAKRVGLPIPEEAIDRQRRLMNPEADLYANFDPIENRMRPIRWNDVVHASVRYRPDDPPVRYNNPPRGLAVVDDEGRILEQGFGA